MKVTIVTNSLGNGDWVNVYTTACLEKVDLIFSGHSIKPADLKHILESLSVTTEYVEVDDDECEEY